MADVDPNLVKAIAEQVLAAIRVASGGGGSSPTEVHAPIGQCTGDYSKFPELKGIQTAPGPEKEKGNVMGMPSGPPLAPAPQGMVPVPVTALKGVVTVSHLRGVRGPIRLAKGAILTPLAQDYIKDKNLNVMTDEQATPVSANAGVAPGNAPTFWWIDGQCPSVAKVIEVLRPNALASRERSSPDSLRSVIKELAGLVKGKKGTDGLLFC